MSKTRISFTPGFRLQVVAEARAAASVGGLARRYELSPSAIRRWRASLQRAPSPRRPSPAKVAVLPTRPRRQPWNV